MGLPLTTGGVFLKITLSRPRLSLIFLGPPDAVRHAFVMRRSLVQKLLRRPPISPRLGDPHLLASTGAHQ
jgi:hypothetical protein